ncbi:hypothetical protein IEO21_09606 [Rhodonia placenta]|uniref:Glucose-methanol-choline oxidoreductase N-terminal domain-containing protein n=1 Tax=Rhodonia placenta TaxID=104341 RepID=A0A8H7TYB2_9APHY|nr:hypothetical protein IEO21_09606 [Postia placenta]
MGSASSRYILTEVPKYATPVAEARGDSCKTYDYVIVGGGTAGCVLASRLSEDPNVTVLLLEAGKSHEGILPSRIPLSFTKLLNSEFDWKFSTTPQEKLDGRRIAWARGRVLGGSSTINAVIYHRCAPEDYDAWEKQGATGWGYETMKRLFLKAEKYLPEAHSTVDPSHHGDSGPWKIRGVPLAPASETIVQACENAGVRRLPDFNTDEGTLGVGAFTAFIDEKSERSSAATAYLHPGVLQRPNLTVAVSITTERILFTNDADGTPRATGVVVSTADGAPKYQVRAAKEVVVCGGAICSPQLLLASGIGPAAHLAERNVPLVRNVPMVGENLLAHFSPGAMLFRMKPGTTWDYLYSPTSTIIGLLRWLVFGTGPLSTIGGQVGVFVRSDDPRLRSPSRGPIADLSSGPKAPDIELATAPMTVIARGTVNPPPGTHGITMGPILLKPQSKGTIRLQSTNIWDPPLIDPNYLATESDMNLALECMRITMRIARSEPIASKLDLSNPPAKPVFDEFWPTYQDPDTVSDEDLKTWLRKWGTTAWHPTSTVKMGASPATSAVDTELRVHGVHGLRVVDASVFPDQVSGHPCAAVIAIAERAAELMKS